MRAVVMGAGDLRFLVAALCRNDVGGLMVRGVLVGGGWRFLRRKRRSE